MDHALVGWWRVTSIQYTADRQWTLLGRKLGERVEFTAKGQFRREDDWTGGCRYRCVSGKPAGLDLYAPGLMDISSICIYQIDGDTLTVCIAADRRPRPKAIRADRSWRWSMVTLERCEAPPAPPAHRQSPKRFPEPRTPELLALREQLKNATPPDDETVGTPLGWFPLATLTVTSGFIWTGDPTFVAAMTIELVEEHLDEESGFIGLPTGDYRVDVQLVAFGESRWIARLRICRDGVDSPTLAGTITEAGTDSALIGVCDPRAMAACFAARFKSHDDAVLFVERYPFHRCGVCLPNGSKGAPLIYVQSGFGDGSGPVIELVHAGVRAGIELPFMPDLNIHIEQRRFDH